ncbi:hypothetical protein PR001_g7013 [Phytophthora rubi]|uniref:Reverse transcriptase RNase H-like domain-containing protein n=1 Tax=Phytophthora rubi TaxID=129364 RepID=A0A6A3NAF3_9STRA|nr:hypothetical protein PR001_g7013 [Phytophthora rubi]
MRILDYSIDKLLVKAREVNSEWELYPTELKSDNCGETPTAMQRVCRLQAATRDPPEVEADVDTVERHEMRAVVPNMCPTSLNDVIRFLEKKVEVAEKMGLTLDDRAKLRTILRVRVDCFRVDFGNDPPVRVGPMQDFWGAVVTQLEPNEVKLSLEEQHHRPAAFLSGRFVGAAARCPTIEKEAFAIIESTRRIENLLLRTKGSRLFTDHRNLVYIFDPYATDCAMTRYQADKLQRWAMPLLAFRYVIEHVPGEVNAWGDLLSRWGAGPALKQGRTSRRVAGWR